MTPIPFSELKFRHLMLETEKGDIHGLFSELRLNIETLPDSLIPYYIRSSDADDSVPATIETHAEVDRFGTLIVNAPLDFGGSDHIGILDWGFDEEEYGSCSHWVKKYLDHAKCDKAEKSFIDYFIEKHNIDTGAVRSIRTCGWGGKAVLRVEYAGSKKDYKPILLAKEYLREIYGFFPEHLNFNNAHYDRIGSSVLNVFDVKKEDFDKFSSLPTVVHAHFDEAENYGELEFPIHNERQCELSYEGKLYEYFARKHP